MVVRRVGRIGGRVTRLSGETLVWALVATVVLVASGLFHAQTRLGREVTVLLLEEALDELLAGRIAIDHFESLRLRRVVARGVEIYDPQGRLVIRASRVEARVDVQALLTGRIRVAYARLDRGDVRLYLTEGGDGVSLVEAFALADPPDPDAPAGDPVEVVVDGITLRDVRVSGDVPGFAGLHAEELDVLGRMTIDDSFAVQVFEGEGWLTGPFEGRTRIVSVNGSFDADPLHGTHWFARLERGDDTVRARVRYWQPGPTEEERLDLRVALEPLRIRTLEEMGIPGMETLSGTVQGTASLGGPISDLVIEGRLRSEAGRVDLSGAIPAGEAVRLAARTQGLDLERLVPAAPALHLVGEASIAFEPPPSDGEGGVQRITARIDPTSVAGVALPELTAEAVLLEDALRIESLESDHLGGHIDAAGRVGYDGAIDVEVQARLPDVGRDPNVRAAAPGVRAALDTDLRIRSGPLASDLTFEGRVDLTDARYGPVTAARIGARGRVHLGEDGAPDMQVRAEAEELSVAGLLLGETHLEVDGTGRGYDLRADSAVPGGLQTRVVAVARVDAEEAALTGVELEVNPGDGTWRGRLEGLRVRYDQGVFLDAVALTRPGARRPVRCGAGDQERVAGQVAYRFRGDDAVELEIEALRLGPLGALLGLGERDLAGSFDGRLTVTGDLDGRPDIRVRGRLCDGRYLRSPRVQGDLNARLDEEGVLDGSLGLRLGPRGRLTVTGPVRLPEGRPTLAPESWVDASLDGVSLRLADLDLPPWLALAGVNSRIPEARISGYLDLGGTVSRPALGPSVLLADQVVVDPLDVPVRAKARLRYRDDALFVDRLWLGDARGELATATARLPLALDRPPPTEPAAFYRQLRTAPWRATIRLAPRRIDRWPEPIAGLAPPALLASGTLEAHGTPEGPVGTLRAEGRWVDAATNAPCAADARPRLRLVGDLAEELVTLKLDAFFGDGASELRMMGAALLDIDRWIDEGQIADFPSTELVADLAGLDLGQVPWLCPYGEGPVVGQLVAKDLLTGSSEFIARLEVPHLRLRDVALNGTEDILTEPYRVLLDAEARRGADALRVCTLLSAAEDTSEAEGSGCAALVEPSPGELLARGSLPIRWVEGSLPPEIDMARDASLAALLAEVSIAPALRLIPIVRSGDLVADGEVTVTGPLTGVRLDGELSLIDGNLRIEGVGQHLQQIRGAFAFAGDRMVLPVDRPLTARDGGGTVTINGDLELEGGVPRDVDLDVRLDEFPVRSEGVVLAWLSGDAFLRGSIDPTRTASTVTTGRLGAADGDDRVQSDVVVRLPDSTSSTLQPLGPHPRVLVVGNVRPQDPRGDDESYPVEIGIDASRPFRVRRSDFDVRVTASLLAIYDDPDLRIEGIARIEDGTFELFGRRFDLSPGSLSFDGGTELNPAIDLTAVYEIPGSQNTITIRVGGTLEAPDIAFTSSLTNDRGEIVRLLVGGGSETTESTATTDIGAQAASFVTGLTAGILTLGLRQEFGDAVPNIGIETSADGARLRVGFNANALVPDFLKPFVTAYIEGQLTAQVDGGNAGGTSSGAGGVGGGVTVELRGRTVDFVLRGSYIPVDTGSLDILYEPR
jgi:hypothetical protein